MSDELEPGMPETTQEAEPKPRKTRAKKAAAGAEAAKPVKAVRKTKNPSGIVIEEVTEAPAKKKAKAPAKKKTAAKAAAFRPGEPVEDPIGDLGDGEASVYTGVGFETEAEVEAYRAEAEIEAANGTLEPAGAASAAGAKVKRPRGGALRVEGELANDGELEPESEKRPPEHLERLQKILSQAGIASRRRAEELITEGRVMVNGQVVTALGTKADLARDHIRVDGKLLHGAERHRYFVLNKPRGYVTTVSDPEGRPTVMDLVAKLGERVYPVGRLDFQSEGLLLMTNDGELANQLTRASSGVEKTYLVKVAGQPSEEDLEKLRSGVAIDRGQPGSGRVRTAPARVRQVRRGENPWYEVVLTEGRNRELRKMFGAVGHFVEKIRRVAYGPLVLDLEPGKLRELTQNEVAVLRLTAEGKLKPRRVKTEAMLPKDAGRTVVPEKPFARRGRQRTDEREFRPRGEKPFRAQERPQREFRGERTTQPERPQREFRSERPMRSERPQREFRGERTTRPERPQREFRGERPPRPERPRFERKEFPARPTREREEGRFEERPRRTFRPRGERPEAGGFEKPRQFGRPGQFERPKRFEKPGEFEKPRRFERPGQFERPKQADRAKPFEKPRQWSGRRPDEGAGKAPGRGFGKGPGRSWEKREGGRPFRKEGGAPGFRGKAGAGESRSGGFPKAGFAKGGFRGKPAPGGKQGGGRRSGPKPFGNRPGGRRRD